MLPCISRAFLSLLLCNGLRISAATSAVQETGIHDQGTVEFLVLDAYGKPLRSSEIEIFRGGGDRPLRKMSGKAPVVTLPYNKYTVRASASLHHTFEREFLLKEPRLFVTLALSPRDHGESPYVFGPPFRVRVSPPPSGKARLWIRFVSLLGVFAKEILVGPSGEASISEVPLGDYIVLVFDDLSLIKTVQFRRTFRNEVCAIELNEKDE